MPTSYWYFCPWPVSMSWATSSGVLAMTFGTPYCPSCAAASVPIPGNVGGACGTCWKGPAVLNPAGAPGVFHVQFPVTGSRYIVIPVEGSTKVSTISLLLEPPTHHAAHALVVSGQGQERLCRIALAIGYELLPQIAPAVWVVLHLKIVHKLFVRRENVASQRPVDHCRQHFFGETVVALRCLFRQLFQLARGVFVPTCRDITDCHCTTGPGTMALAAVSLGAWGTPSLRSLPIPCIMAPGLPGTVPGPPPGMAPGLPGMTPCLASII